MDALSVAPVAYPERTEIARYLLSRGPDPVDLTPARVEALSTAAAPQFAFPADLERATEPLNNLCTGDPVPRADVVVATWTVGNTDPLPQTWPSTGTTAFTMANVVTMLGGEHVVAPSMAFPSGLLADSTGETR